MRHLNGLERKASCMLCALELELSVYCNPDLHAICAGCSERVYAHPMMTTFLSGGVRSPDAKHYAMQYHENTPVADIILLFKKEQVSG